MNRRKRVASPFFPLWLILLAGCATATRSNTAAPTNDSGVINFADARYGITLVYPTDWNEELSSSKQSILVLTRGDETLSLIAQPAKATDLDAMQRQAIKKYADSFGEFQLIDASATTLGGEPARQIVFSGTRLGMRLEMMNVLTVHNGTGFAVVFAADPKTFDSSRPGVEKIIGSVHFSK